MDDLDGCTDDSSLTPFADASSSMAVSFSQQQQKCQLQKNLPPSPPTHSSLFYPYHGYFFIAAVVAILSPHLLTTVDSLTLPESKPNKNSVIESRRSLLRSRIPYVREGKEESGQIIGWVLEKKIKNEDVKADDSNGDYSKKRLEVSVHWCHHDDDDDNKEIDGSGPKEPLVVSLPLNDDDDDEEGSGGLSSYLWPSAIAGSILFASPLYCSFFQNKRALELGSGLGLGGMVASAAGKVKKCELTDRDEYTVGRLNDTILRNAAGSIDTEKNTNTPWDKCDLSAHILDWRDFSGSDEETPQSRQFDVVFGTDLAYYHHLIRPLMDASKHHLKKEKRDPMENNEKDYGGDAGSGLLCIVGQANRESQWDLYNNIKSGSYNQITDQHEEPWDGTTCLLLYDLAIGHWETSSRREDDGDNDDLSTTKEESTTSLEWNTKEMEEIVPIATLLHSMDGNVHTSLIGTYDKIATKDDEKNQMMSF